MEGRFKNSKMQDNNMFKRIGKLFSYILIFMLFVNISNAIYLETDPADSSVINLPPGTNIKPVSVTVQNDYLFPSTRNISGVYVNLSVDDNTGISIIGTNPYYIGTMNYFNVDGSWENEASFNLSFSSTEDINYTVTVIVNGTLDNTSDVQESSVFQLNYDSLNEPNILVNTTNVNTTALDEFSLPVVVYNNGTGDKNTDFNVSVEYNSSLFDYVSCSIGTCDNVSVSGDTRKVYYTLNNLASGSSQVINFTFNATDDKGYSYDENVKVKAYSDIEYPQITINPVPVYEANITKVYNNSPSIINVTTNSLTLSLPVQVRNIGNSIISTLNALAYINGTSLGTSSFNNVGIGSYVSNDFSYKFSEEGVYNFTVVVQGTDSVSDNDMKLLRIIFNFNDSDGDGYFPELNGGLDCNDNNINISPGATEICGNNIDDDCDGDIDETCSSSGGGGSGKRLKENNDDDEVEVVQNDTIQDELDDTQEDKDDEDKDRFELETSKPVKKQLIKNTPLKLKLIDENHQITLKDVQENFVALWIESEPIVVILSEGESKVVDVNEDDINDLKVTLEKIIGTTGAEITIEELEQGVIEGDLNETDLVQNVTINTSLIDDDLNISADNEPVFSDFISKRSFVELLLLGVLVVFVIVVGYGIYYRVNKDDNKESKNNKK